MNKCPYCGANIEENARFCLYCMKPLNKKKFIKASKILPWKTLGTGITCLLIFISITVICVLNPFEPSTGKGKSDKPKSTNHDATQDIDTNVDTDNNNIVNNIKDFFEGGSTEDGASYIKTVSCEYRDAVLGDTFEVHYDLTDKIVITKITENTKDGIYRLPDTIDGKTVIALDMGFFDDSIAANVKTVIIPESVVNIKAFAFYNCSNLSDVYYCGNDIFTDSYAYAKNYEVYCAANITLHCSPQCENRNYWRYSSIASDLGLTYEEWDGEFDF